MFLYRLSIFTLSIITLACASNQNSPPHSGELDTRREQTKFKVDHVFEPLSLALELPADSESDSRLTTFKIKMHSMMNKPLATLYAYDEPCNNYLTYKLVRNVSGGTAIDYFEDALPPDHARRITFTYVDKNSGKFQYRLSLPDSEALFTTTKIIRKLTLNPYRNYHISYNNMKLNKD